MSSLHSFHIPVMGLAYTIDSPVKVARFGISSVISIVEDRLVEMMRSHYYRQTGKQYIPITPHEEDYRAKRITDYLNLVNAMVQEQIKKLKASAFETGSELVKYFELLPCNSTLKQLYRQMTLEQDPQEKLKQEAVLKELVEPGSIDVNIMTKVDKDNFDRCGQPLENGSDALSALRGYMKSNLSNSSVIFSAGMNPRLYNYLETFPAIQATGYAEFEKKVVIKVSDYRSALIQGKVLARKGIWVSEFRIESGLNCGGHAFATDGYLLGPILQEFADKKEELPATLFSLYQPAAKAKGWLTFDKPHPIKLTVQGGIGTYEETLFLHHRYGIESTGWGSPFLLCPEATTVDENTLHLLTAAGKEDVVLSKSSPLGVRFNYLKGMGAEKEKLARIAKGKPGSPCTEKHLVSNTEFTKEPVCTASYKYQKRKLAQLATLNLPEHELQKQKKEVLDKECLCVGLSNPAAKVYGLPFLKQQEEVTVCPGPNIAYFNRQVSLQQMVDHIYGRNSIVTSERPHMFLKELELYVSYLDELIADEQALPDAKRSRQIDAFYNNLLEGIAYYHSVSKKIIGEDSPGAHQMFCAALETTKTRLKQQMQMSGSC